MRALAIVACVAACGGGGAAKPVAPKPTPVVAPAPAAAKPATGKASDLTGAVKSIRVEIAAEARRAEVLAAFAGVTGKPIDVDQLRVAMTQVMKLQGVADVAAQGVQLADGIELVIQVTLNPVMRKLTAIETGGKTIALGMAAMPNNSPFDPHRIQTLAASLRARYLGTGHFDAEVTWRRIPVADGIEVVIEVTPGAVASIASVAFQGNNTIPSRVLAPLVSKLLVVGEPVLDDKLQNAAQALSAHYWDAGYANVVINTPKATAGKNAVVFRIVEGPKFKIGPVKITGDLPEDRAKYLALFGVKQGDVFSRTAIVDGRKRVVDALVATGRPRADALPLTKVDLPAKTIGLTLEINAGPK
jgi:outer membrane protein insertion porin family